MRNKHLFLKNFQTENSGITDNTYTVQPYIIKIFNVKYNYPATYTLYNRFFTNNNLLFINITLSIY